MRKGTLYRKRKFWISSLSSESEKITSILPHHDENSFSAFTIIPLPERYIRLVDILVLAEARD
jgi:hypothetical protein